MTGRMAPGAEAGQPARLGLVAVDGEGIVVAPARMGHVIDAAADRAVRPGVEDVKGQRRIDRHHRVHRGCGLPRLETHARHGFARTDAGQRHHAAIAQHLIAAGFGRAQLDLQAFGGTVGIAHSPADGPRFAQDVPGFQGLTQFQMDALDLLSRRFLLAA